MGLLHCRLPGTSLPYLKSTKAALWAEKQQKTAVGSWETVLLWAASQQRYGHHKFCSAWKTSGGFNTLSWVKPQHSQRTEFELVSEKKLAMASEDTAPYVSSLAVQASLCIRLISYLVIHSTGKSRSIETSSSIRNTGMIRTPCGNGESARAKEVWGLN